MSHVLSPFGWSDRWAALAATAVDDLGRTDATPGRVVRHDGVAVIVASADGEQRSLPWLGTVDPAPVVGDWVLATSQIVVAVLPRSSLLRRRDPHRDVEQALVANVEVVFVVCGLDRQVKPGRIQRVTTLAWDAGAVPVVVLTKADVVDEPVAIATEVAAANPGVDVLVTSSATGAGVEEVRAACVDRTVVLLGESGAGKSTLVSLLLRFVDPDAGRITLDGTDLRELNPHALREAIAVVLQETLLFDGTVRDNIAYGRTEASDEEIAAAACAADADGFIAALPDGYATRVGQRGRTLSGGQRQRIAIARALLRDAPILILDEPTTGLDEESAERILAPLRRLMEGRTTILISHDPRVVTGADRVVALEAGRVAAVPIADSADSVDPAATLAALGDGPPDRPLGSAERFVGARP